MSAIRARALGVSPARYRELVDGQDALVAKALTLATGELIWRRLATREGSAEDALRRLIKECGG